MARFLRPQQPHDRAKRLLGWCATATFLIWLAVAGRHVTGLAFDYGSGYSSSPAPGAGMAEEPAMAVRTMSMQSSQQAAIVQEPVPAEQQLAEQAQLPEEQAEQLGTGDSQQQAEAAPEGARVIGTYIHALPDGTEISKDLLDEPLPGVSWARSPLSASWVQASTAGWGNGGVATSCSCLAADGTGRLLLRMPWFK